MISQEILKYANFQQQLDSVIREVNEKLAFFDGKQFVDNLTHMTDQNVGTSYSKNDISL